MTDKRWKEELTAKTQEALERGAFGAPFFWVVKTDTEGQGTTVEEEPFFGSDRYVFTALRRGSEEEEEEEVMWADGA